MTTRATTAAANAPAAPIAPIAARQVPAELAALSTVDPAILDLILVEEQRQADTLEMIASENHTSRAVMAATGSCLTNKYCEGYPGRRYYNGCGNYDRIEQLAIDRACELFGCNFANVQPHSGASANIAVQFALLEPGDTFAAIELSEGGHLTHGSPVNLSGKWLNPVTYKLVEDESDPDYGAIDMASVEAVVAEHQPKLIMCGYSAHPKKIDFAGFKAIADKHGCLLWCDMAHIAGLVAGGAHDSPFPYCDVVTTTTHKTLRGPRGGLILTNDEELSKKINKAVFPGTQGGPLMHAVAGKAVCFGEALKPEFKTYADQTVKNAQALAEALKAKGYKLAANGTENHLVLVDLRPLFPELTGKEAAIWLEDAGIITNMNTVPQETRSPFKTSGVRLGTPALTTRGLKETEMSEVAGIIHAAFNSGGDEAKLAELKETSKQLAQRFPMPH